MTVEQRSPLSGGASAAAATAAANLAATAVPNLAATPITDLAWERIRQFLHDHGSAITTVEATRLGLTSNDLRGLVRRGLLERIAQGAYIWPVELGTASDRHLAGVRALVRARPAVAASHISAAVVHGLPVMRTDLGRVHLTHRQPSRQTRRRDAFTLHRCPAADAFTEVSGLHVVVPPLAVLGTVLVVGIRSGIAAADAALRQGLTSREELEEWMQRLRHTPGLGAARHVVVQASATAESAGESLTRLVLIDLGYVVIPQFRVVQDGGRVVARVDFYLPELGVVVEFDGRVKYEGHDGADALAAEKQREDRIRALGYGMARLVWADLFHLARVRAAVEQAARTAVRRG